MRVRFLLSGGEGVASSRYRVYQYLPYLEEAGVTCHIQVIPSRLRDRWPLWAGLGQYDVTFIQRRLFTPWEVAWIRKKSRVLIYDFDDAVMYRPTGESTLSRRIKFRKTMQVSDVVIAGNAYLKAAAACYSGHVVVLPTSVDVRRYRPRTPAIRTRSSPLTLGWIGSRATLGYLRGLSATLDHLHAAHPNVVLKVVADDQMTLRAMPVINKPWSHDEEVADVAGFDIGLMPLPDDPWTRGKCGLKLLQYMAAGVPVVGAAVGVNREIIQDGVNGFLAGSRSEWEVKLSRLIADRALRQTMGQRGRERVETAYALQDTSRTLIAILTAAQKQAILSTADGYNPGTR